MKNILANKIQTPDGTILTSHHTHDYVVYTDKNGLEYMVDGGLDYLRRNVHEEAPYKELSVYDDDQFELIRKHFCRGGRGKDGKQPLTFVPLCEMSDMWLVSCVEYVEEKGIGYNKYVKFYRKEIEYRVTHSLYQFKD